MNQNNAIKLLKYQTNSWGKIDALNAQIAELQWMCKRIRQALYGVMAWIMLDGAVRILLAFI